MSTQSWIMQKEDEIIKATKMVDEIHEVYKAECNRNTPPSHNQLNHDVWGTLLHNASNLRTSIRQLVACMNVNFYAKPQAEVILTADERETVLALRAGKCKLTLTK